MESQAQYVERCRAGFKIKTDAHMAREIGLDPRNFHAFKSGKEQLSKKYMLALANRAGLDPNEALVLRALWASQIETIPNYASYLRKFAGVFLAGLVASSSLMPLKLNNIIEPPTSDVSFTVYYEKFIFSSYATRVLGTDVDYKCQDVVYTLKLRRSILVDAYPINWQVTTL